MTSRGELCSDAREKRSRPPLPVRDLLAAAVRAARHDPWRILAVTVTVSLLTVLADIAVTNLIDHADVSLAITGELTSSALEVLGSVFLSGFLCRIVGSAEHGQEHATVGQVFKSLPWVRLILADLLVVVLVVVGLVALVIPGLLAITLLAVVGPVIEIEHRRVLAAIRRSCQLTRSHIWPVLLLATAPLAAVAELEAIAPEPDTASEIAEFLIVRGLAEGIAEACLALLLSELCFQLIDAHRGSMR